MYFKHAAVFIESISMPYNSSAVAYGLQSLDCMNIWSSFTVHDGFFNVISIFNAYISCTLTVKVVFFFSSFFARSLPVFISTVFQFLWFFSLLLFPFAFIPFSSFHIVFFQNVFSFPFYSCCFPQVRHLCNLWESSWGAWRQTWLCRLVGPQHEWELN